jgi:hypothetical protein
VRLYYGASFHWQPPLCSNPCHYRRKHLGDH